MYGETIVIETKQFLTSKRFWAFVVVAIPLCAQFFTGPSEDLNIVAFVALLGKLYVAWLGGPPLSLTGDPKIIVPPQAAG